MSANDYAPIPYDRIAKLIPPLNASVTQLITAFQLPNLIKESALDNGAAVACISEIEPNADLDKA